MVAGWRPYCRGSSSDVRPSHGIPWDEMSEKVVSLKPQLSSWLVSFGENDEAITIKASSAGTTEHGFLLFYRGQQICAGFAPDMWVHFTQVDEG